MGVEFVLPRDIEKRSFQIIEEELTVEIDEKTKPIVKRVIHTTADFSYCETMAFSENVVDIILEKLKNGCPIVTDTTMAMAGINKGVAKKLGCSVHCFIGDEDVLEGSKINGTTRSVAAVDKGFRLYPGCIFVCGNAPTALIRVHQLIKENKIRPSAIIGVPVGFVNVVESKELIMELNVPYIVAKGRKGGSNVAAAIVNALMYMV